MPFCITGWTGLPRLSGCSSVSKCTTNQCWNFKLFMEARNRIGGIDSMESIIGLLKSLKIRALCNQNIFKMWKKSIKKINVSGIISIWDPEFNFYVLISLRSVATYIVCISPCSSSFQADCKSCSDYSEHQSSLMHLFTSRALHCNENPVYAFLFWELRGLSPNFHIHVSQDRSPNFLQQNRQTNPGKI